MDRAEIWSTQWLVEFLATVSSFEDECSAVRSALEMASEALEAEIGFVVRDGRAIASIGIPANRDPDPALLAALGGDAHELDVPGIGPSQVLRVPLHDPSGHIVLLRAGDDAFTQIETSLAGGMARVLVLALRNLRLLEAERALREQSERQAREALHDPLTGLPNRRLFFEQIDAALVHATAADQTLALLFMDMDGFKVVNDSLGHHVGDQLLVAVAERVTACLPAGGIASRLGGDEFALLVDAGVDGKHAVSLATAILAALERPFALTGREVFVTASIGIAHTPPGMLDRSELLRCADVAMYRAKADGGRTHAAFETTMQDVVFRRLELEADLRTAIREGNLFLQLQPIVDVDGGEVTGAEALVRWPHPVLGTISPLDFVPLAEETGLIVPLGAWVLDEACRHLRALELAHPAGRAMSMSVNVSARQLREIDFPATVIRALARAQLSPDRLVLEITESVLLERTAQTTANLDSLRELGVRLAIDDFGTGYSSLRYLQQFPIDILKIDKTFIDGVATGGVALVRAVVNLARSLGLSTTAEGVETSEQLEQIAAIGCDRAQGYLFARPLGFDDLVTFVGDRAHAALFPTAS